MFRLNINGLHEYYENLFTRKEIMKMTELDELICHKTFLVFLCQYEIFPNYKLKTDPYANNCQWKI